MNSTLLMWGSLAVFGALAAGEAVLAVRAASGTPPVEVATAFAGLLVLGASLMALRNPETSEPPAPWVGWLAAASTAVYVGSVLV
ncbi:MAG: hypothetical protein A07HB70_00877 [uncultured archaeon A07HB70]|nr:MAG: hypothetical protein A07HB70_00877 [uncultured archaeon A07HB70]